MPRDIAHAYLKSWFIVDFSASIPFEILAAVFTDDINAAEFRYIRLLKCLRLLRMGRIVRFSNQHFVFINIWRIFRLFFFLLLLVHWVGCFFFFLGQVERDASWIINEELDSDDIHLFTKYIASAFVGLQMLLGGPFYPFTPPERTYYVITRIFGAGTVYDN